MESTVDSLVVEVILALIFILEEICGVPLTISTELLQLLFNFIIRLIVSESPKGLGILIVQLFSSLETIIWQIVSSPVNSPTNLSYLNTASPIFSVLFEDWIGKFDMEPRTATG